MADTRREVIFEFRVVGDYVKVSAIDTLTNTEVSITGPARADRATLQAAALNKLRYVLTKGAGK